MLIPKEVFQPRKQHTRTSEAIMLIMINFIVISIGEVLFFGHQHINWFFWIVVVFLALYNFFSLRKNLEVYSKVDRIVYTVSTVVLAILVVLVYFFA
jgi:hypothetical protein